MSGLLARFFTAVGLLRRKSSVLVVGLDNSGKSTIVQWLKDGPADATSGGSTTAEIVPTVGFSVEQFARNKVDFTVFDMSGQGRYRNLWEHYYSDAEAIIFVLDSADRARVSVARDELDLMLQHKAIGQRPVPILFFANKMDLAGALTPVECSDALSLERLKDRPWHITACTALTGDGLSNGMDWLVERLF